MDQTQREKLIALRELAELDQDSVIPLMVREKIVEVAGRLLDEDASNEQIAGMMLGGMRAALDCCMPSDDDSIMLAMYDLTRA